MSLGLRTGLRRRLMRAQQRMHAQHGRLRELLRDAESAARAGSELGTCVGALREGLRAHFELEEAVCFPALHGLEPASRAELERLVAEHRGFIEELGTLEVGAADASARVLRIGAELRDHEIREERLIGALLSGDVARA